MRNAWLCVSIIIISFIMIPSASGRSDIKRPNVSGQFYNAHPEKLSQDIQSLLSTTEVVELDKPIELLIAPHAGYMYSGGVAAHSYKAVRQNPYKTIIVLAPSHFFGFDGVSIWERGGFETPLGMVPVDEDFASQLIAKHKNFYFKPEVFEKEHSLEVQLPFLQETFTDFKIVPIIMGQPTLEDCQSLARALAEVIGKRQDVLIVVSTDLSHYHPGEVAKTMDRKTLMAVQHLQAENVWEQCRRGTMEMCGCIPVVTAMFYAREKGLNQVDLLKYAHSGDVTGDMERVVGYASLIFSKNESARGGGAFAGQVMETLTPSQKKRLVEIARQTVDHYVKTGKILEFHEDDPRLKEEEGAFVTLHKGARLRGCIGHVIGRGPLYQTVRDMAIAAASKDPRFSPVTQKELKDIEVEVSVLSKPRQVQSADEVILGEHGVIISQGPHHHGLFLPQVAAETGWSKEEFLSQLSSQKAGLPRNAWKDPKTKIEVFTADVFAQKDVIGE